MDNLNLAQLLSTTPYDFARGVQKDKAGLAGTLAENDYKKALTLNQQFQTEKGQALLPTDVLKAEQETDPSLHSDRILNSNAEATTNQLKVQQLLRDTSDKDFGRSATMVFQRGKTVLESALVRSMMGENPSDFLPEITKDLMKDPEKGAEISRLMQPYLGMPREQFIQEITSALKKISEVQATLDPAQIKAVALASTKQGSTSTDEALVQNAYALYPGNTPEAARNRQAYITQNKVATLAASVPKTVEERKGMGIDTATGLPFTTSTKATAPGAPASAPPPAARQPATPVNTLKPGASVPLTRAEKEAEVLRMFSGGKQ